jgi:hypothetical protein
VRGGRPRLPCSPRKVSGGVGRPRPTPVFTRDGCQASRLTAPEIYCSRSDGACLRRLLPGAIADFSDEQNGRSGRLVLCGNLLGRKVDYAIV